MKKGFLLNSTDANKAEEQKQPRQQPSTSSGSDVKVEEQKHQEVQQPESADVRGAVEQRYTQAEINHFITRLETMRALGMDS